MQQIRCIAIIQFCIAIKCHITLSIFTYIAYFKHNQFELSIENSEHLNNFIPKYHTKNLKCIFKTRKICFFTKFSFWYFHWSNALRVIKRSIDIEVGSWIFYNIICSRLNRCKFEQNMNFTSAESATDACDKGHTVTFSNHLLILLQQILRYLDLKIIFSLHHLSQEK